jgi:hypothetical protein
LHTLRYYHIRRRQLASEFFESKNFIDEFGNPRAIACTHFEMPVEFVRQVVAARIPHDVYRQAGTGERRPHGVDNIQHLGSMPSGLSELSTQVLRIPQQLMDLPLPLLLRSVGPCSRQTANRPAQKRGLEFALQGSAPVHSNDASRRRTNSSASKKVNNLTAASARSMSCGQHFYSLRQ